MAKLTGQELLDALQAYMVRRDTLVREIEANGRSSEAKRQREDLVRRRRQLKAAGQDVPNPPRLPKAKAGEKPTEQLVAEFAARRIDIFQRVAAGEDPGARLVNANERVRVELEARGLDANREADLLSFDPDQVIAIRRQLSELAALEPQPELADTLAARYQRALDLAVERRVLRERIDQAKKAEDPGAKVDELQAELRGVEAEISTLDDPELPELAFRERFGTAPGIPDTLADPTDADLRAMERRRRDRRAEVLGRMRSELAFQLQELETRIDPTLPEVGQGFDAEPATVDALVNQDRRNALADGREELARIDQELEDIRYIPEVLGPVEKRTEDALAFYTRAQDLAARRSAELVAAELSGNADDSYRQLRAVADIANADVELARELLRDLVREAQIVNKTNERAILNARELVNVRNEDKWTNDPGVAHRIEEAPELTFERWVRVTGQPDYSGKLFDVTVAVGPDAVRRESKNQKAKRERDAARYLALVGEQRDRYAELVASGQIRKVKHRVPYNPELETANKAIRAQRNRLRHVLGRVKDGSEEDRERLQAMARRMVDERLAEFQAPMDIANERESHEATNEAAREIGRMLQEVRELGLEIDDVEREPPKRVEVDRATVQATLSTVDRMLSRWNIDPERGADVVDLGFGGELPFVNRSELGRTTWSQDKRKIQVRNSDGTYREELATVRGAFAIVDSNDKSRAESRTYDQYIELVHLSTGQVIKSGGRGIIPARHFDVGGWQIDDLKVEAEELEEYLDPLGRPAPGRRSEFKQGLRDLDHQPQPRRLTGGDQETFDEFFEWLDEDDEEDQDEDLDTRAIREPVPELGFSRADVTRIEQKFARLYDRQQQHVDNTVTMLSEKYNAAMRQGVQRIDRNYLQGLATDAQGNFKLHPDHTIRGAAVAAAEAFLDDEGDELVFAEIWDSWEEQLDQAAELVRQYYDPDKRGRDTQEVWEWAASIDPGVEATPYGELIFVNPPSAQKSLEYLETLAEFSKDPQRNLIADARLRSQRGFGFADKLVATLDFEERAAYDLSQRSGMGFAGGMEAFSQDLFTIVARVDSAFSDAYDPALKSERWPDLEATRNELGEIELSQADRARVLSDVFGDLGLKIEPSEASEFYDTVRYYITASREFANPTSGSGIRTEHDMEMDRRILLDVESTRSALMGPDGEFMVSGMAKGDPKFLEAWNGSSGDEYALRHLFSNAIHKMRSDAEDVWWGMAFRDPGQEFDYAATEIANSPRLGNYHRALMRWVNENSSGIFEGDGDLLSREMSPLDPLVNFPSEDELAAPPGSQLAWLARNYMADIADHKAKARLSGRGYEAIATWDVNVADTRNGFTGAELLVLDSIKGLYPSRDLQNAIDRGLVIGGRSPMAPPYVTDDFPELETQRSKGRGRFWGDQAAGILPISRRTGRILVPFRSGKVHLGNTWGVWGGKVDADDLDVGEAALREFAEEAKFEGRMDLVEAYRFEDPDSDFTYQNFLGLVEDEFDPALNWETSEAQWMTLEEVRELQDKHFGLEALLRNSDELLRDFARPPDYNPDNLGRTMVDRAETLPLIFNPRERDLEGLPASVRQVAMQAGQGHAGRFHQLTIHHRQLLADALVRSIAGKQSPPQTRAELEKTLGIVDWQARQLFHDSTQEFSREVNAAKAEAVGLKYYRYWGPLDGITRPFCRKHVGQVYTLEEINALDNEQTGRGSVMIAAGGYNCRHHWRGVSPNWYTPEKWLALRPNDPEALARYQEWLSKQEAMAMNPADWTYEARLARGSLQAPGDPTMYKPETWARDSDANAGDRARVIAALAGAEPFYQDLYAQHAQALADAGEPFSRSIRGERVPELSASMDGFDYIEAALAEQGNDTFKTINPDFNRLGRKERAQIGASVARHYAMAELIERYAAHRARMDFGADPAALDIGSDGRLNVRGSNFGGARMGILGRYLSGDRFVGDVAREGTNIANEHAAERAWGEYGAELIELIEDAGSYKEARREVEKVRDHVTGQLRRAREAFRSAGDRVRKLQDAGEWKTQPPGAREKWIRENIHPELFEAFPPLAKYREPRLLDFMFDPDLFARKEIEQGEDMMELFDAVVGEDVAFFNPLWDYQEAQELDKYTKKRDSGVRSATAFGSTEAGWKHGRQIVADIREGSETMYQALQVHRKAARSLLEETLDVLQDDLPAGFVPWELIDKTTYSNVSRLMEAQDRPPSKEDQILQGFDVMVDAHGSVAMAFNHVSETLLGQLWEAPDWIEELSKHTNRTRYFDPITALEDFSKKNRPRVQAGELERGRPGRHWGKAYDHNPMALATAFAGGAEFRPLNQGLEVSTKAITMEQAVEGELLRRFAQRRLKDLGGRLDIFDEDDLAPKGSVEAVRQVAEAERPGDRVLQGMLSGIAKAEDRREVFEELRDMREWLDDDEDFWGQVPSRFLEELVNTAAQSQTIEEWGATLNERITEAGHKPLSEAELVWVAQDLEQNPMFGDVRQYFRSMFAKSNQSPELTDVAAALASSPPEGWATTTQWIGNMIDEGRNRDEVLKAVLERVKVVGAEQQRRAPVMDRDNLYTAIAELTSLERKTELADRKAARAAAEEAEKRAKEFDREDTFALLTGKPRPERPYTPGMPSWPKVGAWATSERPTDFDHYYRGMMLDSSAVQALVNAGAGGELTLTGATACSAYREIGVRYAASDWSATIAADLGQTESTPVLLEVERDAFADKTITMFHNHQDERGSSSRELLPPFEVLSSATRMKLKEAPELVTEYSTEHGREVTFWKLRGVFIDHRLDNDPENDQADVLINDAEEMEDEENGD